MEPKNTLKIDYDVAMLRADKLKQRRINLSAQLQSVKRMVCQLQNASYEEQEYALKQIYKLENELEKVLLEYTNTIRQANSFLRKMKSSRSI